MRAAVVTRFEVEFVWSDEATPRDLHTTVVEAVDAEQASLVAFAEAHLAGDRIQVAAVTEQP